MAVTADKAAPYAPPSTVLEVIKRHRDRGLPLPVNKETLVRGGVAETIIPRVLQALQTLDLIDDAGQPTPTFEGLRKAPEAEYKTRMAEWLNAAYADALQFVDPATADETQVRDAFRNYIPTGQQNRMVTLFIQLYAAAGVGAERQAQQPRPHARAAARPASNSRASGPVKIHNARAPQKLSPGWTKVAAMQSKETPELPPVLAGLMASLPQTGMGWTQEKREQFLKLFGTALDWCFPIRTQQEIDAAEEGDENE